MKVLKTCLILGCALTFLGWTHGKSLDHTHAEVAKSKDDFVELIEDVGKEKEGVELEDETTDDEGKISIEEEIFDKGDTTDDINAKEVIVDVDVSKVAHVACVR